MREAVESGERGPRLVLWLSLAWLVGFSLFFYSFTLPNNHVSRFLILFSLPDLLSISEAARAPWSNLLQRADVFGVAILIWAGAWGLGQLAMRVIRPPIAFVGWDKLAPASAGPPVGDWKGGPTAAEPALSHPTGPPSIEHTFFAMALGLSAVGLLTLFCGVAGLLDRRLFLGIFAAAVAGEWVLRYRGHGRASAAENPRSGRVATGLRRAQSSRASFGPPGLIWLTLAVAIPFLFVMWLGSMSSDADFDVGTYHFEGPKEYFQNGRITFLPHNVYTNFPFLTELFALLGMVLHGDWYWGAMAGKCALFLCAPLTALGLYAAGRRWFGPAAGLLAAVVYVTTPWIDRVSIIGLAEGGMTYFLFATLFAAMLGVERLHAGLPAGRWMLMTGLLAGSGMGCKYTGLMQVVIPAVIGLGMAAWIWGERRRVGESATTGIATPQPNAEEQWRGKAPATRLSSPKSSGTRVWSLVMTLAIFGAGVAVTTGPWLLKNVWFTGNPVYPLAYNIFGGRDWNPELDARFGPAHSPKDHRVLDLGAKFVDVMADNDWSSPLAFGLAPLALFMARGRRISIALWALVAYLIVTYWAFTHRIDRFWMPLVPVVALLAGVGASMSTSRLWVWGAGFLIALGVLFNFGVVAGTGYCGYNAMLTDRTAARRTAENAADSFVAYLNESLPPGAKVLSVGDSQMFGARFPVVYNTVFNPSIFQKWLAGPASPGTSAGDLPLRPSRAILDKLHAEGITHIYVDWDWIRRYREPGNYGFTDFVRPSRFDCLVRDGVLRPPVSIGMMSLEGMSEREVDAYEASLQRGPISRQCADGRPVLLTGRFGVLSDQELAVLKELGPSLLTKSGNREVLINAQVFPVR